MVTRIPCRAMKQWNGVISPPETKVSHNEKFFRLYTCCSKSNRCKDFCLTSNICKEQMKGILTPRMPKLEVNRQEKRKKKKKTDTREG